MLRVKESASYRARIDRWSFFKTSICFINFKNFLLLNIKLRFGDKLAYGFTIKQSLTDACPNLC